MRPPWMAVLAVDNMPFLADGNGARLSSEVRIPERVNVLLPYRALTEGDLRSTPGTTSDSMALLVAAGWACP